jgi:DNA-binding MarR family transcriptional regulator/N-acetylglutamate synthase-like GNAT family acetyltransferase
MAGKSQNPSAEVTARTEAVRRFNRFYTRQIGLLQEGLLGTDLSLAEARVLYEIGRQEKATATSIAAALDLDHGYLSRTLRSFAKAGLITKTAAAQDRRQTLLALTAKGRVLFRKLDRGSQRLVGDLLAKLSEADQQRVVSAMRTIETALGAAPSATVLLRPHRPGDMGWVLTSHALVYGCEYGWGGAFEALAAEIVTQFLKGYDPAREICLIAEIDGIPVGSVFLVHAGDGVAKLRLFLVEERARGHGVGTRLVDECIRFAREAGYRRITLWTQSILVAARKIYERAGFRRVREEPHRTFGIELVGETWELAL